MNEVNNKLYILIPAYQPNDNLLILVKNLIQAGLENIVVVNDGSSMECQEIFSKLPSQVIILKHQVNLGKGAALKTGFRYLLEQDNVNVITADADGQHIVDDIKKVYSAALDNPHAYVLGVRQFGEQEVPWRSRFGNELTKKIFQWFCHYALQDTQTGLRAIPAELQKKFLTIHSNRYEFESESLMLAIHQKVQILQVPISTIYIENNRSSHFNPFTDSIRIYLSFFRRCFLNLFKK